MSAGKLTLYTTTEKLKVFVKINGLVTFHSAFALKKYVLLTLYTSDLKSKHRIDILEWHLIYNY